MSLESVPVFALSRIRYSVFASLRLEAPTMLPHAMLATDPLLIRGFVSTRSSLLLAQEYQTFQFVCPVSPQPSLSSPRLAK